MFGAYCAENQSQDQPYLPNKVLIHQFLQRPGVLDVADLLNTSLKRVTTTFCPHIIMKFYADLRSSTENTIPH